MAGFNPVYAGVGDNKLDVYGATDVAIWTMAFTASDTYLTGGLALLAATFGLSRPIAGVVVLGQNTAGGTAGMVWIWNTQTQKLQAFWTGAVVSTALAEVTNTTSIASVTLTVLVITQR
jgi:hypothetical protein